MTRRSRAREVALQLLYQHDYNVGLDRATSAAFAHSRLNDTAGEEFCLRLVYGVLENLASIDERIATAAENWRVSRMAGVDRAVLRLATYELLLTPETPPSVVIDEAIELARRFGAADSPAFVNGVLDSVRKGEEKQPTTEETGPAASEKLA